MNNIKRYFIQAVCTATNKNTQFRNTVVRNTWGVNRHLMASEIMEDPECTMTKVEIFNDLDSDYKVEKFGFQTRKAAVDTMNKMYQTLVGKYYTYKLSVERMTIVKRTEL